jgi:DNA-binding SARP family transcriptional activator
MAARPSPGPSWDSSARAVPPRLAEHVIRRPQLDRLLDAALTRRLTVVVADPGFGKTTLLAGWLHGHAGAWYTVTTADRELGAMATGIVDALSLRVPALASTVRGLVSAGPGPEAQADEAGRAVAQAAFICEALEEHLARELVLVLDDLSEVKRGDPAARFVEALTRMAPPRFHLVVSTRAELPFPAERLRGQGQAATIPGAALAFQLGETEKLLRMLLGRHAARLGRLLQDATGGWPAAIRLAAEALRAVDPKTREQTLERVLRPGGPVWGYLMAEAIEQADPQVRRLLELVGPLQRFTTALCERLGLAAAGTIVPEVVDRGLFLQPLGGEWYQLHPLLRQLGLGETADRRQSRELQLRAAEWYTEHGEIRDALAMLRAAGDQPTIATLLATHGAELVERGGVDTVIEASAELPPELRSAQLHQLEGEARQIRGDWDGALRAFRASVDGLQAIPAAVAWRMGLIFHLRGQLDEALATYGRGALDQGDRRNEAMLRAWWASALWLRGDVAEARRQAEAALADATAAADDRSLAASHTVLAMIAALDSDRRANDAHYLRALDHATRAHDVLQLIRIHANRGSHFAEEGYYAEALAELDEALRLADLGGFAAFRALALSNRGDVLLRVGRLDEAIAELEASRALYQRLESRLVSYPLGHLGDVYRERGDMAVARVHFEEAIDVAERAGDVQGLVPSLNGLARILVRSEPEHALELVRRALSRGPVLGRSGSLLALGWVNLSRGDRPAAQAAAAEAEQLARQRRDRPALAEALELSVRASSDAARERDRLAEALALWQELGSALGVAKVELAMAELLEGDESRELAERALQHFREIGARRAASAASAVLETLARAQPAGVQVRTLGGLDVLRDRRPVPLAEWRSRKARDALKMLLAARGRRLARESLMESLWPEEDPARSGPRLSVVLSTIRSVLDPAKAHAADHYVQADRGTVRLAVEHLAVDLETFNIESERGLRMLAGGDVEGAWTVLQAAEGIYRGDFLGDDPYEDWAVATREEARATYQEVLRALSQLASKRGAPEVAAGYLRRLLEQDPYDEPGHLRLVAALGAAGHHGDARRAYRRYAARMHELGVEPAPLPDRETTPTP